MELILRVGWVRSKKRRDNKICEFGYTRSVVKLKFASALWDSEERDMGERRWGLGTAASRDFSDVRIGGPFRSGLKGPNNPTGVKSCAFSTPADNDKCFSQRC